MTTPHATDSEQPRRTDTAKVRGDGYLYKYRNSEVWWGKYYIPGNPKPQRFSTGERDEKRAAKVLRKRTGAVRNGHTVPEEARRLRYADLEALLFADYRANGRRSLGDLPRAVKPLRLFFGGTLALGITTARMRDYTASRLEEKAARATINKELAALGRMLTLAFKDGPLPTRPAVPKLRIDNARQGFVEPADAEALYAALPDYLEPPTRYANLTGQRKRNVFGLLWSQIAFDPDGDAVIRLAPKETKNNGGQVLAFAAGSPVAQLLARQHARRRLDCPYVFHRHGRPVRDFYTAWRTACAKIGRRGLLFHDLRRSAVRNMVRAGVSERICMARSGHKTRAIFDRYNIVNEADLREADLKVAAYLTERVRAENGQSERKIVAMEEKREEATG
jgi:hypothetical protein